AQVLFAPSVRSQSAVRSANSIAPATTVGRLQGTDLDGQVHRLGASRGCRGVVVLFLATQCPISNACLPQVNQMAAAYQARNIEFFGVISDRGTARTDAVQHRRQFRIRFPVLYDPTGELRHRLHPTHTPEVFVLTPQGAVLYRGRIDDRYAELGRKTIRMRKKYLSDTLRAVAAGQSVNPSSTEPV